MTGMPCEKQIEAALTHIGAKNRKLQEIHGFCVGILAGQDYSTSAHDIAQAVVDIMDEETSDA